MGTSSPQRTAPGDERSGERFPNDWQPRAQTPAEQSEALGQREHLSSADTSKEGLRSVLLANAVEYEIIPRLMLAHRIPDECVALPASTEQRITPEDMAMFAELVLHEEDHAVRDCVIALKDRGVPMEAIFLDLLSPVARHLGDMWDRDLCSFTEVTAGLGRLQKVLRENSASFGQFKNDDHSDESRRILLMPCPGEQHTFGLSMVAEIFHRANWDVVTCFLATDAAAEMVKNDWYDVIGFSLGGETGVAKLKAAIAQVRKSSKNPEISVIAGGPVFIKFPEFGDQIQADAIMTDGLQAPAMAAQLVAHSRLRPTQH